MYRRIHRFEGVFITQCDYENNGNKKTKFRVYDNVDHFVDFHYQKMQRDSEYVHHEYEKLWITENVRTKMVFDIEVCLRMRKLIIRLYDIYEQAHSLVIQRMKEITKNENIKYVCLTSHKEGYLVKLPDLIISVVSPLSTLTVSSNTSPRIHIFL